MIRSYRSKALRLFATRGDASKLPISNPDRLRRMLAALDAAKAPEDMNLPGFRFHGLAGNPKRYATDASGNYRLTLHGKSLTPSPSIWKIIIRSR